MNLERDCRGSSTVSCLNTQSPVDGAVGRVRRFGLLEGGELWEFKGSSHFKFDLGFVLQFQMRALNFLLSQPRTCSAINALTLQNSKSTLVKVVLVMTFYHSNRKVTNT